MENHSKSREDLKKTNAVNDNTNIVKPNKDSPSYYAIVTANIRYDKKIIPSAKLLFAEIKALSTQYGFCYCGNHHFMELYNVSVQTINNWLKNLEDNKYIKRHLVYKKGTKHILNRYITINGIPYSKNIDRPIKEILKDTIKHSNKINSNTNLLEKKENNQNQRGCII
ncbi:DNA-binding transcriptional regulator YiaG [Wenyingzhuangia heitensis]|uniref:DNA-binding transcriptional regulator YiaG n=1 Tax=Wenyingzhuangia heitensis TaxID=1487859 RepID=A0ABX0UCG5_9FLAO|nr:helix-turn-helix domain-containing protein [Wenyingzhuangia heitensis]NIJ46529.1 DNA-binding transcriptional regulator YiaG [Wenyingzhuangia heitensis]